MAADSGGGTELNFIASNVLFVITEQYTENQYTYSFPVAEVGQRMLDPNLGSDCTSWCWPVQATGASLVPGAGNVPAGMQVQVGDSGYVELTGSPASGSQGAYTFDVQVDGGSEPGVYHCTLVVAPPLGLTQRDQSSYTYETGVGFAPGGNVLHVTASGGVDCCVWALTNHPSWLSVAYSPTTPGGVGRPPVLWVPGARPGPGTYRFHLQAWDDYTAQTSAALTLNVVPPLTVETTNPMPASQNEPYHTDLRSAGGVGPYHWAVDGCKGCGSLPAGMRLASDGTLSGTPTRAGTFPITLVVGDAAGAVAAGQIQLVVVSRHLSLQAGSLGTYCSRFNMRGGCIDYGDRTHVTATRTDDGMPVVGRTIHLQATGGTLGAAQCTTGSDGSCSVTFTVSPSPRETTPYTVAATAQGLTATTSITYYVSS